MMIYQLKYFFDAGSGICLWSKNDPTREKFGYPINHRDLSLSENVARKVDYIIAWYDTSLDWENPSAASVWSEAECERFKQESERLLILLRQELGSSFEIEDCREQLN